MIIHGIWHDKELPTERCYIDSWSRVNRDAEVKVWTFEELEHLMELDYPEVDAYYWDMPFLLQRANVLRMVALHKFGGIYLDLDMKCINPFGEYFDKDIFFSYLNPYKKLICNAIMGSAPQHPFWESALDIIPKIPVQIKYSNQAVGTTGAIFVTKMVKGLNLTSKCADSHKFFPLKREEENAITVHCHGFPRWFGKQYAPDGTLMTNANLLIDRVSNNI